VPTPAGPARIRWGVLGAAKIAIKRVIPGIQKGQLSTVTAIASRDIDRARREAAALGIAKAYGSYEDLLADPEIDAVYNPLPNHLHVPWSTRAAEAGKHVLCEKPIALTAAEGERLIAVRDRTGMKIQEAFMVRSHPRWIGLLNAVRSGRIGQVRSVMGVFSYFNDDAANIRNKTEYGGGAVMDIGCYLINLSRMIFEKDPLRVSALVDRDPVMRIDRLSSMLLDFGTGHALGMCSTQLVAYQQMQVFGTLGRLQVDMPFNTPPGEPCRILTDDGTDLAGGGGIGFLEVDACDQYTIQADMFSRAILEATPAPYPLEDSVRNMRVIEAVFRAADSGCWESPAHSVP
jgi:predicted dehydrogenase